MIQVAVNLVDFMNATPVGNASITLAVKVVPRWQEVIPPDFETPGGPTKPITILNPRTDLAEEFIQQGRSDTNGAFRHSFNVSTAFQRARQLTVEGQRPYDVVAVVSVRIQCAGLDRTVQFGSLSATQASQLLGENSSVNERIAVDFAKVIVGHTTSNSTLLWFVWHGELRSDDRYACVIESLSGLTTPRTLSVTFDRDRAKTATLNVTGLQPNTPYSFRLIYQDGLDTAFRGATLATGEFTTTATNSDRLRLAFGSCHLPTGNAESLERWQTLARRDDYDLMLLIGDQIYGDDIERMNLGRTWFDRYVNRYHRLWTYWPMREVMRRTPTYMTLDDHEIVDDWGVVPVDNKDAPNRLAEGLRAYQIFQQAHNPGGYNGPLHYSFRRGPASFFVMDSRSGRSIPPENAEFPILGRQQWEALQAWSQAPETRAADVIFFVAPVPIAFLPVEEIRRLIDDLKDESTLAGALVGAIVLGPLGAAIGAYAGHEVAESKLEEKGLADLTERDLADMWTYEPNQKDLTRVLDCLFNLANDIQPDGRPGPRPRAVFILGGDVHSGSMHMIRSNQSQHGRNPLLYQMTSSAISHEPATDKTYEHVVSHIRDGVDIGQLDLVKAGFDAEALIRNVMEQPAKFVLDSKQRRHYAAEFIDLVVGRNFGHVMIERARSDRRVYHIYMFVEAQAKTIRRAIELDLDAPQIQPRELFGTILAAEGKVSLLRVHDVGTGYGPSKDNLDVEVVIQLDSEPNRAFGFQLRNDANEETHRRMLDTLRDAFNRDRRTRIDYVRTGLNNGKILRVAAVR